MPTTPTLTHAVLYDQGTFDGGIPDATPEAEDIAASGFGTVALGQWHVHADGSIYYNTKAAPLSVAKALLQKYIPILKRTGRVSKVLISFGAQADDWTSIRAQLPAFKQAMAGFVTDVGADGFDWDFEGDYTPANSDLLVDLTGWAAGLGLTVTAAPYVEVPFWQTVLGQTNGGGAAGFAWWNIQLYGGANYPDWVAAVAGMTPHAPAAFVVPALSVKQGGVDAPTPQALKAALVGILRQYPACSGAGIWRYEDFKNTSPPSTAAEYANAIAAALSTLRIGAGK